MYQVTSQFARHNRAILLEIMDLRCSGRQSFKIFAQAGSRRNSQLPTLEMTTFMVIQLALRSLSKQIKQKADQKRRSHLKPREGLSAGGSVRSRRVSIRNPVAIQPF
jgi:hypothetical protein